MVVRRGERNACLHPVLVSDSPGNMQAPDLVASLLFENLLTHLLELNLELNPTGSLKPNQISLPLSFLPWGRSVQTSLHFPP